ncbi:ABC transporter substrate-binding protein [Herbiconiux sp. SYSU D00978]|uniref:ABC transporter substrate-binding protein n=1 Tax=Herbiconiux sp. SYSU D00978 TaxID=2812562 RepID=UPI001A96314B|nr:ABC transporter substrate-binding protein [Herbiconiux sp. SYSU D00978]
MSAFVRASASRSKAVSTGLKALAFGAGVLLLASCASGNGGSETGSGNEETSSPAADRPADGVFSVGTILPQTGSLEFLGPPEFAGVDLAIADIEAAGDAFPFSVENNDRDSGDTTTDTATLSAEELIGLNTDVIVGAASSGVSFTFIDAVTGAGIVQISPANTSPDFSEYDDDGYYWRTAPSDVLQGRVLGNLITGDGFANVGIIYLNDPYGIGLTENATEAIEAAGGAVTAAVTFNENETQFAGIVDEVLASGAEAIAVIAFDQTASIIPELVNTQGFPGNAVYFVDGNLSNSYEFEPGTLEGAKGTLPGNFASAEFQSRLLEIDPSLTDFSYSAESYDAVILSALAAVQADDDSPKAIRDNLESVSKDGTKCETFQACLDLLANGEDIDYDGPSGPITFDENGDPTEAYIGIYQYGADNKYTPLNAEFGSLNE